MTTIWPASPVNDQAWPNAALVISPVTVWLMLIGMASAKGPPAFMLSAYVPVLEPLLPL